MCAGISETLRHELGGLAVADHQVWKRHTFSDPVKKGPAKGSRDRAGQAGQSLH